MISDQWSHDKSAIKVFPSVISNIIQKKKKKKKKKKQFADSRFNVDIIILQTDWLRN